MILYLQIDSNLWGQFMKNKKNLLIVGIIVIVLGVISSISNFEEDVNNNLINTTDNQVIINNVYNITETQEEKIYEDDDTINKYINN